MLKVIDVGLGRTGTTSLKQALEELGLAKCYNFIGLYDNPEHPSKWLSASRGEKVDWEKLFEGYQSAVYWPPSCDYLEFLELYPDSKVVVTVRDPEKWYKSMHDTVYNNRLTIMRKLFLPIMGLFKPKFKTLYDVWHLQEETLWQNTFKGQFSNKKYAIEVFLKHIEDIKSKVPADRLLVFDVKDGWEPLCHFLKVTVPDTTFPHVNDSAAFLKWRSGVFKIR